MYLICAVEVRHLPRTPQKSSAIPDHVRRVDVLHVADLVLLAVGLLDRGLHEVADSGQPLVPGRDKKFEREKRMTFTFTNIARTRLAFQP